MKLCKDCNETTIMCDFCKYSREAIVEETEELLWCMKFNKGVDICYKCEEFYCIGIDKE